MLFLPFSIGIKILINQLSVIFETMEHIFRITQCELTMQVKKEINYFPIIKFPKICSSYPKNGL